MPGTDEGMPVEKLIADVKDALIEAGVTGSNRTAGLRLGSVRLILKVIATQAGGGRLNFHVPFIGTEFRIGVRLQQHNLHNIDITLVPPDQVRSTGVRSGEVQDALVAAISQVRNTVASAAGGESPWYLSDAKVDISFGVTKEETISVGFEGNQTSETTNTLRLILAPA